MIFSHSDSKTMNETLTMHINVAVAQAVGNLTQRSHEEVDQMHQKMIAKAEVGEASMSANCEQMMEQFQNQNTEMAPPSCIASASRARPEETNSQ